MNASATKQRVGFIGLGAMGAGMAANIIKGGYPLTVMAHRRREAVERLLAMGASEVSTPADLAANADIIILCVTTSAVVEQIVLGDDGLLAGMEKPFLLIDCGTSQPESTAMLGDKLTEKGCTMMDVPLGRSAAAAEAGTLNMMAGGTEQSFIRAQPLLETMSENLFHVGDLGVGHKIKLINNAYSMSVACLIAEAVKTASSAGVDLKLLYDVMTAGPNRSEFFDWMMAAPLSGDESKLQFSLQNGLKDITYFNAMADAAGVDASLPRAAQSILDKTVSAGHGGANVPGLSRVL